MQIENSSENGKVRIDCQKCGRLFDVIDFRTLNFGDVLRRHYEERRICPECVKREAVERAAREEDERVAAIRRNLPAAVAKSGIPEKYSFMPEIEPPVRFVAEWIWRYREKNILISGVTGSGKSTSACYVAARLIAAGKKVFYSGLRSLLALWRGAKTGESARASEAMLKQLYSLDILIIDEVIGKAVISGSAQELLFDIIESVNNGSCRARVWLLGNFYAGSIENTFADAEPVRRRLSENFFCVLIDEKNKTINELEVWREK